MFMWFTKDIKNKYINKVCDDFFFHFALSFSDLGVFVAYQIVMLNERHDDVCCKNYVHNEFTT